MSKELVIAVTIKSQTGGGKTIGVTQGQAFFIKNKINIYLVILNIILIFIL